MECRPYPKLNSKDKLLPGPRAKRHLFGEGGQVLLFVALATASQFGWFGTLASTQFFIPNPSPRGSNASLDHSPSAPWPCPGRRTREHGRKNDGGNKL